MPVIFLTSKDQEQDEIIGLKWVLQTILKNHFHKNCLNERIRTVLKIYENRNNKIYKSKKSK